MTTLREARKAASSVRRHGYYDIVLRDPAGALRNLQKAERDLSLAPAASKKSAEAKVAKAKAAVDACRFRQWFEAITAAEREVLLGKYPLPPKDERPEGFRWGYIPAIVAACAVEVETDADGQWVKTVRRCADTAEDWAADLADWSEADFDALWAVVNDVQTKPANAALPKG